MERCAVRGAILDETAIVEAHACVTQREQNRATKAKTVAATQAKAIAKQPEATVMRGARLLSLVLCLTMACKLSAPDSGKSDKDDLPSGTEIASFPSGTLTLRGLLLRPPGTGPFPAILYNHGSAPGTANNLAFANIAPVFVARGWVFFMPYRRGQGLSASAGPYIGDQIEGAKKKGGLEAGAAEQLRLLQTDHLDDQLAAFAWLRRAAFVQSSRIAVAGNSFGGIEAVFGAEHDGYCAAVDASGAAESWVQSPELIQCPFNFGSPLPDTTRAQDAPDLSEHARLVG